MILMNVLLIFVWVYLAMIAMAFWESEVEGKKAWDKGKLGWKIKIGRYCVPAYHIFVFVIFWPFLLTLPLVIYGWNLQLTGVLISAYFSGMVLEDFMWYVVNPAIKFSDSFNSEFANYYPWLKIGKFEMPISYFVGLGIAVLSWLLIWK